MSDAGGAKDNTREWPFGFFGAGWMKKEGDCLIEKSGEVWYCETTTERRKKGQNKKDVVSHSDAQASQASSMEREPSLDPTASGKNRNVEPLVSSAAEAPQSLEQRYWGCLVRVRPGLQHGTCRTGCRGARSVFGSHKQRRLPLKLFSLVLLFVLRVVLALGCFLTIWFSTSHHPSLGGRGGCERGETPPANQQLLRGTAGKGRDPW